MSKESVWTFRSLLTGERSINEVGCNGGFRNMKTSTTDLVTNFLTILIFTGQLEVSTISGLFFGSNVHLRIECSVYKMELRRQAQNRKLVQIQLNVLRITYGKQRVTVYSIYNQIRKYLSCLESLKAFLKFGSGAFMKRRFNTREGTLVK